MIRIDELKKIADMKKLSLANAEKDYLLDIMLFNISHDLGDALVLKGGTSLYKLHNLNRFSEDLDFTLNKRRFDAEQVAKTLLRAAGRIGIYGDETHETRGNEINIRFHFKGPLYSGRKETLCYILLNISHRERVACPLKKEILVPVYREIPSFNVYAMDEREIFAEKVRAIMTRLKPRDVYDLWFLLKKGVSADESLINKKLKIYKKRFVFKEFKERVGEKKSLWQTDLRGLIMGALPEFDDIQKDILERFKP
jgi:predicted nucleotidyltransferase component of viral defense system